MVEQLGHPEILRILTQVSVGFAIIEFDGTIRFANESFAKIGGHPLKQLIGASIYDFDDEIDVALKKANTEKLLSGECDQISGEIEVKTISGSHAWVSYEITAVRHPITRKPEYQFLMTQDITARVRAERLAADLRKKADRKLQESEERFRTLAETIPQIVFTTDSEGHFNYMNGKWFQLTGEMPGTEISSDLILQSIHPEDLPSIRSTWKKSREHLTPFYIECRLRAADGDYRWFLTAAMPLFDGHGRTTRWFGSCTDIDQQKKMNEELRLAREKADRANRMKSHFLANMSHEIRTPLGAILGFTELLGDPNLDDGEREEFLGVIARNGHSLSRIVDDVLDLSKVEAGLLSFEKTPFCPKTLVSDVATLFSERARKKGIRLETEIASDLAPSVISDSSRIRQIVANLVSNAVKFTHHGYVKIRAESTDKNVCFRVEDSGIGIGSEHLGALFQPFVQGDESLSRKHGGTGLGLYLSRKLAEALGGTLEISRTTENIGTTLTLSLPLQIASPAAVEETKAGTPNVTFEIPDLRAARILIVDDAPDNRLLIARILAKTGAKVEFASSGQDGIEQSARTDHDVILMDLQMPEMDGFQAAEIIRGRGIQTPIVALTAHAIDEIRERCERSGFNGFLTKPLDSRSLITLVDEFSGAHRDQLEMSFQGH